MPYNSVGTYMDEEHTQLEHDADKLLAPYLGKNRNQGIHRDCDLIKCARRFEVSKELIPEETIEIVSDCRVISDDELTLSELFIAANLTPQQSKAAHLKMGHSWKQRPLDSFGRPIPITQKHVAKEMGLTQGTVSVLLRNARKKMEMVAPVLVDRMAGREAYDVFMLEIKTKKAMIFYRQITHFKPGELKGRNN
jgi:hypothetical protein